MVLSAIQWLLVSALLQGSLIKSVQKSSSSITTQSRLDSSWWLSNDRQAQITPSGAMIIFDRNIT